MFTNKIDKYMHYFLSKFNKTKDFNKSFKALMSKYNINQQYACFVIYEIINLNYITGVSVTPSMANTYFLNLSNNQIITRKGYKFIDSYRKNIINLFLIPFKNLILIIITAIITTFINNGFHF